MLFWRAARIASFQQGSAGKPATCGDIRKHIFQPCALQHRKPSTGQPPDHCRAAREQLIDPGCCRAHQKPFSATPFLIPVPDRRMVGGKTPCPCLCQTVCQNGCVTQRQIIALARYGMQRVCRITGENNPGAAIRRRTDGRNGQARRWPSRCR